MADDEDADPFPRDRIDKFYRPHVNRIYNSPSLTYVPPLPIPHIDIKIIHQPTGCRVYEIDKLNPEFPACMNRCRRYIDLSDKLSVPHQKRIKEWAAMCGQYALPGFTKPQTYIEHMFKKPTKTIEQFNNRRVFDTASEAIQDPVPEIKITSQDEYLQAVDFARRKVRIMQLRDAGKFDEAEALETGAYDVYLPEGVVEAIDERTGPPLKKTNVMSRLPDYAHEVGRSLLLER